MEVLFIALTSGGFSSGSPSCYSSQAPDSERGFGAKVGRIPFCLFHWSLLGMWRRSLSPDRCGSSHGLPQVISSPPAAREPLQLSGLLLHLLTCPTSVSPAVQGIFLRKGFPEHSSGETKLTPSPTPDCLITGAQGSSPSLSSLRA